MNSKAWRVIEAVRNLRMTVVSTKNGESVKVAGAAAKFPERLVTLQKALEELDREGGFSIPDGSKLEAMERENEMLRNSFEQVFRWMRRNDIDTSEPYAILEECLGIPESKRAKNLTPAPGFAKKAAAKKRKPAAERANATPEAASPQPSPSGGKPSASLSSGPAQDQEPAPVQPGNSPTP